jgi:amino acid permease
VIQAGGNIGDLVSAFQAYGVSKNLKASLDWFSNFAILTSFLSIGLGLFHFFMDGFKRPNTALGRAQAALIAFIPPALASYFLPYGFIKAIGYAGLLVAFSFFVIPAWMHIKQRGLSWQSSVVMCFGISVAILKILMVLGLLPVMGG